MSIALLYNHLKNTDYFSLDGMGVRTTRILLNVVVRVDNRAEAERLARCMRFEESVLRNANHLWAFELSLANPAGKDSCVLKARVAWLSTKLLNYHRSMHMDKIKETLPILLESYLDYDNMTINDAIKAVQKREADKKELLSWRASVYDSAMKCNAAFQEAGGNPVGRGNDNLLRNFIGYVDCIAWNAPWRGENYPQRFPRDKDLVWRTVYPILAPALAMGDPLLTVAAAQAWDAIRQPVVDALNRIRADQKVVDDIAAVARRAAEAEALRVQEEQRRKAEEAVRNQLAKQQQISREVAHAEGNNTFRIVINRDGKEERLFIDKSEFDAFVMRISNPRASETEQEEDREQCCMVCLTAKPIHSCGNSKCPTLYCSECFNTWFLRPQTDQKCGHCRLPYIPLAFRVNVAEAARAAPDSNDE